MHAILYLVFKILLSTQTTILALTAAAADASRHAAALAHFQILNNRVHNEHPLYRRQKQPLFIRFVKNNTI
jgi:hypothetical protein